MKNISLLVGWRCIDNMEIDKESITNLISLVNQKKFNQVINEALDLLNQYPSSYDLYNILGVTHNLIGKKAEAGLYFSKSYKINPNEINTINNLANFYFESRKFTEAIPLYNEAINLIGDKKDSFDILVTQGAGSVSKVCESIKDIWKR